MDKFWLDQFTASLRVLSADRARNVTAAEIERAVRSGAPTRRSAVKISGDVPTRPKPIRAMED